MVRRNSRYFPKTGDDSADQGALRRQISHATAASDGEKAEGLKIGASSSSSSSSAAAAAAEAGEGEATKYRALYERVMYVLDEAFATSAFSFVYLLTPTPLLAYLPFLYLFVKGTNWTSFSRRTRTRAASCCWRSPPRSSSGAGSCTGSRSAATARRWRRCGRPGAL